jgi:hypothetical protein
MKHVRVPTSTIILGTVCFLFSNIAKADNVTGGAQGLDPRTPLVDARNALWKGSGGIW